MASSTRCATCSSPRSTASATVRPVTTDRHTWTYSEIVADANRLSHALAAMGVRPGTAVALLLPTSIEYVVADQPVLRCGRQWRPNSAVVRSPPTLAPHSSP